MMTRLLLSLCVLATAAFAAGCSDDEPPAPAAPTGCAALFDTCDANATCAGEGDAAACVCDDGWEGDGTTCTDTDECAAGTDTCGDDTMCVNTDGGFRCACDEGFLGDGEDCTETDECALGLDDCAENAECTNVPGSWTCACPDGFEGDGTTSCDDVDECAAGTDDCSESAECVNTPGSFTCECAEGFAGDDCFDVDECISGTDNCADADGTVCTNTAGSFECSCGPGWTGDGLTPCEDVDECADETDTCSDDGSCTNVGGSFECACNEGFEGDGFDCIDIDECASTVVECEEDTVCANTVGSFGCVCDPALGLVANPEGDGCLAGLFAADGRAAITGNLYFIDPFALTVTTVGEIGWPLTGIAMSPNGALFGTESTQGGETRDASLVSVDPVTGAGTAVAFLVEDPDTEDAEPHNQMPSATFLGDVLYAWTERGDDLTTVNIETGEVIVVGDSGNSSSGSGIAASAEGVIWGAFEGFNDFLHTVSTEDGVATQDITIGDADHSTINSIAWANGVLYAVGSEDNGGGFATPHLVTLDVETGEVTVLLEIPSGVSALTSARP